MHIFLGGFTCVLVCVFCLVIIENLFVLFLFIKVIFFDLGDVIIGFDFVRVYRVVVELLFYSVDEILVIIC